MLLETTTCELLSFNLGCLAAVLNKGVSTHSEQPLGISNHENNFFFSSGILAGWDGGVVS